MITTLKRCVAIVTLAIAPFGAHAQSPSLPVIDDLLGGTDSGSMDALLPTGLLQIPLLLPGLADLALSNNGGPLGVITGIGGPLRGQLVPVFDVLTQEPDQLFTYFMEGGTVVSTELVILPAIPLVTAPLALD